MNKLRTVSLFLAFSFTAPAMAERDNSNIYGFITQGYFKSTDNNFYGKSKDGSFDFTEVGVGGEYSASDFLSASGLLLSRRAGLADDGHVRVDNLVFDIKAYRGENSVTGVRLGRNKIPFGFYNATRDVSFTRPTLLLPQSIYHDHSRNFLINADGLEAYHDRWDDDSYTKFNFLYEKTNGINNPQTETYFLGMNWPGELDSDYATGLVLNHAFNQGKTRVAAYYGHLPVKYKPGQMDPMPAGTIITDVVWLSAQHEILPKLTITAETFLPRITHNGFGPIITDRSTYPLGWYVQGTYAYTAEWELYGRFDQSYRDKHDKNGELFAAATGRPAHMVYADDWTIGANYYPSANWMISAEFHRIKGTAFLPALDNPDISQIHERWNLFGLQAAYRFR